MNISTATATLKRLLQEDEGAAKLYLGAEDLAALLAMSAGQDQYETPSPYVYASWTASAAYGLGTTVRAATLTDATAGVLFTVTTAGTSGASEPSWDADAGETTADGSVVWTTSAYSWEGSYDLNLAAAEGWRWKAGRVAGSHDFSQAEAQSHRMSQLYDHCVKQAELYSARIQGTLPYGVPDPYAYGYGIVV